MIKMGFNHSKEDSCMFVKNSENSCILLTLYVADGLIAATHQTDIDELIISLQTEFLITHTDAKYYLGLEIHKRPDGSIFVNQKGYAQKLLERFGMSSAKRVTTPLEVQRKPEPENIEPDSIFPFPSVIGSLMYLMCCTRSDIAYAMSRLCQKLDCPTTMDVIRAKRILRYIAGSRTRGILYQPNTINRIYLYSDADYAGCPVTGKSTSGVVALYPGGAISWLSKLQSTVALSTMTAEIMAASEAAQEVEWLQRLVFDITNVKLQPPLLYMDNSAAVAVAHNPEYHRRIKYLAARHFYVRDAVTEQKLKIEGIRTDDMLADGLTKTLPPLKHNIMVNGSGLTDELGGQLK